MQPITSKPARRKSQINSLIQGGPPVVSSARTSKRKASGPNLTVRANPQMDESDHLELVRFTADFGAKVHQEWIVPASQLEKNSQRNREHRNSPSCPGTTPLWHEDGTAGHIYSCSTPDPRSSQAPVIADSSAALPIFRKRLPAGGLFLFADRRPCLTVVVCQTRIAVPF